MIVADVLKDAKDILGKCSQEIICARLTEAIRLLSNKGDWNPLIGFLDICSGTDNHTFTLPMDVETPLAVNIGGQPKYFRNMFHEFHLNGNGSACGRESPWTWDDAGFFPVLMDIKIAAPLIALAQLQSDIGSKIRVYGYDQDNGWIRSQQPDGTWIDGFYVNANLISDFPGGIISPFAQRPFSRILGLIAPTTFVSSAAHGFVTGASGILSLSQNPLPSPLIVGARYFVNVLSPTEVTFHATEESALINANPIEITSYALTSEVNLSDSRQVQARTKFTSADVLGFIEGSEVEFSGSPLPEPLETTTQVFAHLLDDNNFTIHETSEDAIANINPLFVTTPGATVVARAKQIISPYTILDFSVDHNLTNGDQVTFANAGGLLPTPLIPGNAYYIHYITSNSLSVHSDLTNAILGTNPITLSDAGTGSSAVVKIIPATATLGTSNNITAANHGLNPSGGDLVQFQSTGTLPTPLVQTTVYRAEPPSSTNTFTVTSTALNTKDSLNRRRSNNIALIVTSAAHGYITGDRVDISGMGDPTYDQVQAQITVVATDAFTYTNTGADESVFTTLSRYRKNSIAYIETSASHGLSTGDYVNIQGVGGSAYNLPYVQVTVTDATHFNYPCLGNDEGTGNLATINRDGFNVATITTSLAHGLTTGELVDIVGSPDVSFNGSNISITVVNSTQFTYPNVGPNIPETPAGSAYFSRTISDTSGKVATAVGDVAGTITFGRINITDSGSGQLYVVISRAFTIGFTDVWLVDAANLPTETKIKLDTDGVFPTTSPAISPLNDYYVRHIDDFSIEIYETQAKSLDAAARATTFRERTANVATITTASNHGFTTGDYIEITGLADDTYNTPSTAITVTGVTTFTYTNLGANEGATADVGGLVYFAPLHVQALGSGPTNLVLERSVTVTLLSNELAISYSTYLADDTVVQFSTDGTLPGPLLPSTDYKIKVVNGLIEVYTTLNTLITLTSIGSGAHQLVHAINFMVEPQTSFEVPLNEYNDGDAVTFGTTGTAPSPLVVGTTYYVRRLSADFVELYDTYDHAIDTASTTGRIFALSLGAGEQSINSFIAEILVSRIERILISPELRNGFLDLYAWDDGRDESLTILGHYSPIEREPKYRRIKVQDACQWVRMRYRRKSFKILTDEDYIPLNSQSAITMMLRSMELYRTNFFDEAQKYEGLATKFLMEDHEAISGPETITVQFNSDIYQNGQEAWMQ